MEHLRESIRNKLKMICIGIFALSILCTVVITVYELGTGTQFYFLGLYTYSAHFLLVAIAGAAAVGMCALYIEERKPRRNMILLTVCIAGFLNFYPGAEMYLYHYTCTQLHDPNSQRYLVAVENRMWDTTTSSVIYKPVNPFFIKEEDTVFFGYRTQPFAEKLYSIEWKPDQAIITWDEEYLNSLDEKIMISLV